MKRDLKIPFKALNTTQWQNLVLAAIFFFYFVQFASMIINNTFLVGYGGDHLSFLSTAKIARKEGFDQIYDLNTLKYVQAQEYEERNLLDKAELDDLEPTPAPIFSFFVLPLLLLTRIDVELSYWIWTILNLAILISYLHFFIRKLRPITSHSQKSTRLIVLMVLSFPVIENMIWGQVEVFLLLCTGEFLRNAQSNKQFLSGLWLGGLLLKPQVLVLIIPVLIIMRYWKPLWGFLTSFIIILAISFLLSGFDGLTGLINLYTGYASGIATNWPERMVNWRMIGVIVNSISNSSIGWIITGLGMVLTLVTIYFLVKRSPQYGSSTWVMIMLGVFSATLVFTWHSHYHMSMVLIPFMVYGSLNYLLSEKLVFAWVSVPTVILVGMIFTGLIILMTTEVNIMVFRGSIAALSGFLLNLSILGFLFRSSSRWNLPEHYHL